MTDLLAVYFLIGVSCLLTILLLIFKDKLLSLISRLGWATLGIYNFGRVYNSGDADAGQMVWVFGWVCMILALVCWTSPLWLMKKTGAKKEVAVVKGRMERVNERVAQIRKYRPKKRDQFWE